MPITSFLGGQKFDAETTRVMGVAFEMARVAIVRDWGDHADAVVANRIIELGVGQWQRGQLMRKGLAYVEAAETCRHFARQVPECKKKKQLNDMAMEWETLAAERARQLAKGKARRSIGPGSATAS